MKRLSDLIVAAMLTAWFPMATAEAGSCTWIGPAAGNWNNPDNWTPSQVPGSGDTAAIPAGSHSVVIDNAVAINGLSIGAGSSLTLAAQMDLYGPLNNAGTLSWQDGDIIMYNSAAQGSTGAISNAAGGVLDIGCDRVVVGSEGAPQLHNAGTLRKTATTGSTEIIVFFDSTGVVDVQSGTINCYVGGNLGGVLQAASAATIYLISGDYVFSNTPTFQGLGQVGMYGSLVLTGSYSGTFGIFGGSLALGSDLTVASDGILNIQGLVGLDGQLTNAGTIHIADLSLIHI